MSVWQVLLLLAALVLVGLAALGVSARRVHLGWLGVFCWLLATVLPGLGAALR